MSRKAILLLVGLYFLAAVAFSFFRVVTDPFLSGLNAAAVGNAVGGALLLYGGAGLLPVVGWAFRAGSANLNRAISGVSA
jgi:hypothetical protein